LGMRWRAALAACKLGDTAGAEAVMATTASDCYDCIRMRGNIADVERNWGRADYWFARAVQQAPSIPFAYADWGQSFLARGKPDGAIAQFTIANQKGPHFADPLESWGEARMAKNQSHLALKKFAEAQKYAPNWGRLHLKWGEALVYAGKKDEAKAQFARAATLDLTRSEKAELARQSPHASMSAIGANWTLG
jgi:tetratricopeptide (TPR) repeat protein